MIVAKEIFMPDSLRKNRAGDAKRVNVHEKWEVDYWSRKFGVSEARLKQAAHAVGPMAANIQRYLKYH